MLPCAGRHTVAAVRAAALRVAILRYGIVIVSRRARLKARRDPGGPAAKTGNRRELRFPSDPGCEPEPFALPVRLAVT